MPYNFTHMWNLTKETGKWEKRERQRGKSRKRLLIIESKLMFTRRRVGGGVGLNK